MCGKFGVNEGETQGEKRKGWWVESEKEMDGEGGKWKKKEKGGGQREFYQTFTALVIWQAWQSKAFHHATPYQRQSSCCLTHTTAVPQSHPSPLPPISSLPATLWLSVQDNPSPTPKYHRSVKRYFQGPGSLAVTCWVSAQKAKALHTCRWHKTHTNTLTPELIRHWYSPQMQMEASAFHR